MINDMIFLKKSLYTNKNSAHLIASGPAQMIHFWSVFGNNEIKAKFYLVNSIKFSFPN
jgi:hypothetical protein